MQYFVQLHNGNCLFIFKFHSYKSTNVYIRTSTLIIVLKLIFLKTLQKHLFIEPWDGPQVTEYKSENKECVVVKWTDPLIPNGIITEFKVYIFEH